MFAYGATPQKKNAILHHRRLFHAVRAYLYLPVSHRSLRGRNFAELIAQKTPHIKIDSRAFSIDIDVAKNRADPDSRTQLLITAEMAPEMWRPRLMEILLQDRHLLAFKASDIRGIGAFFELQNCVGTTGRTLTSYTLHRNYCHRAIEYCRNSDGTVDWEKAIGFTLHKSVATLKAAYAKRIADEEHTEQIEDSSEEQVDEEDD